MEIILKELVDTIQQQGNSFDWASAISAVCSVVSLIAIIVLLKERSEKKRPYLQVSFELVKSSLVCLIIRNVGETPAKLKEIKFNRLFVDQLPPNAKEHAKDRTDLNISIYPKQQWVLCLDVITPEVLKYKDTQLEAILSYTPKGKRKLYTELEVIDFNDYSGFLVYISEIDELTGEIKKLTGNIDKVEKSLKKLVNNNYTGFQTQSYANISDIFQRTIVTEKEEPTILKKAEEQTND